ncbi:hypothetical protein [Solemya velesiana gill symbiont]|uniref:hypothetical protein n=1 Tax=Solemya velesiana gill symbiont TaxID=1918948 RepID=UPI002693AC1E
MPGIPGGERLLQSKPYNLLLTREWMLLVPRSHEFHRGVFINALGFAGSLFVKEKEQITSIRTEGPMALLRNVAMTTDY